MKTHVIGLIFLFLLGGTFTVEAQFGRLKKRIQNRVERKIDDKINREVDKAVDEAFEDAEESIEGDKDNKKKNDKKKRSSYDMSNLGMEVVEMNNVFNFSWQIDWEMTSDGEKPTEMSQLISDEENCFAILVSEKRKAQSTVIFDTEKDQWIIIPENGKQAMLMNLNLKTIIENGNDEIQNTDATLTPTGKTKSILGYNCKQYIFSSSDSNGEMWVTNDLDFPNHNLFQYFQKITKKKNQVNQMPENWEKFSEGFLMEMKATDKDGKTSTFKTTKVDKNISIKYDMAKYEVMNISGYEKMMGY